MKQSATCVNHLALCLVHSWSPENNLLLQLIILQLWEETQQPLLASRPQPPGGAAHNAEPSQAQAGQATSVPTTLPCGISSSFKTWRKCSHGLGETRRGEERGERKERRSDISGHQPGRHLRCECRGPLPAPTTPPLGCLTTGQAQAHELLLLKSLLNRISSLP